MLKIFLMKTRDYGKYARPVVYSGMFLPFVVGGGLFADAKIENNNETLGASFAVLQASLIEFLYNCTLKAITGRSNPDWRDNTDMDSLSKNFQFGFLKRRDFLGMAIRTYGFNNGSSFSINKLLSR